MSKKYFLFRSCYVARVYIIGLVYHPDSSNCVERIIDKILSSKRYEKYEPSKFLNVLFKKIYKIIKEGLTSFKCISAPIKYLKNDYFDNIDFEIY